VAYNVAVLEVKEMERDWLLAAQKEKALPEPNPSVQQETRAGWSDSSRSDEPEPWSPKVIQRV
jgi:hypothetical protein